MIDTAAEEAPDAIAWVDADGALTFREVADHLPDLDGSGPVFVTPGLDRESFLTIHSAIRSGRTLVLTHPRADPDKAQERIARLRAYALPPMMAIMQTSGTTGVPKEVLLSRRAFSAAADASAERLGWEFDDRWGLFLPPAHVGGLSVLVRCALAQRTVVAGDPQRIAECIERDGITIASLVPAQLDRLLADGWRPPEHLRVVLLGGDSASPTLRQRALDAGVPIAPTYGMTETCAQAATLTPREDAHGTSCGRPLAGVEFRVVDGELHVRGATLMDGVLVPHGETYTFVPLPEDGWYATGDLGELDDGGCVHITGRASDRIVTGGENVDPASVERALLDTGHIHACCVFGVPDARFGQLVAVAAVADADHPLDASVRAAKLAQHERPRLGAIVESLPTLGPGKVDRAATAKRFADPAARTDLRPLKLHP